MAWIRIYAECFLCVSACVYTQSCPHTCFMHICVWVCAGLCVFRLELRFTPINHSVNPPSAQASPGYGSSSSSALSNPSTFPPFGDSERITCVHSSFVILFYAPHFFLPLLSLHLFPSLPIFLLSPRPPGCSLSKPIVSMRITNKLCSSKRLWSSLLLSHTFPFNHILLPWHAPSKPSILGWKNSHSKGTSYIEFNHKSMTFFLPITFSYSKSFLRGLSGRALLCFPPGITLQNCLPESMTQRCLQPQ